MLINKFLPNWPITVQDNNNVKYIFGTDLEVVKVKTMRLNPNRFKTEEYVIIDMYLY